MCVRARVHSLIFCIVVSSLEKCSHPIVKRKWTGGGKERGPRVFWAWVGGLRELQDLIFVFGNLRVKVKVGRLSWFYGSSYKRVRFSAKKKMGNGSVFVVEICLALGGG